MNTHLLMYHGAWSNRNNRNNQQNIFSSKLGMDDGAISETHIPDAVATPTPVYSTVSILNYNFRVLNSEFHSNTLLVFYASFLWVALAFSSVVLVFTHSLHLQPYPFFMTLAAALLPLNAFAIYNRQIFTKSFLISSILFNLIIITLSILFSFELHYSGVAFGVYLILETASNCCLMENQGKVLLKALMMVQLLIICLKVDEAIVLQQKQALFGLIIIFLFFMVLALSVFVYSVLLSWCLQQNCFEIKQIGMRFLAFNMSSASCLMAIPIWTAFINDNYNIPAMLAVSAAFLTASYSFFRRAEIALFLCKTLQIATKEESQLQLENRDPRGMPHLFQVSSNWFVEKLDLSTCESGLEAVECVVCIESKADTVWQPCGHCSLCDRCMKQLLGTQIANCPLCKSIPSSIVRVGRRPEKMKENEFEVMQCIAVGQC